MEGRIGSELAGYRIESVIGRGGMGVVYLAEHLRLKRKVALKILASELAEDERFRRRFIAESELAASLDHPNVVPIYDAGEADGVLYIAMRLVPGTNLKSLIEAEGALEPSRAVSILTQVAGALDAAHGRGLIHRDVKSANVLIEPGSGSLGERAYLTDFGLTKRPESVSGLTKTGQFLGSVEYATPEQFEGKPLSPQTDVYSLGCVLHECLTGRVPFERDSEAAVMYAHLRDRPPRPSTVHADLPPGLDAVVATAMSKSPDDRYPTAGDLTHLAGLALAPAELAPAVAPIRKPRLGRMAGLLGALVVVSVIVLVAVTQGGGGTPPPSGPHTPVPAVVRIDPATNRVVKRIPIAGLHKSTFARGLISVDDRFVWVTDGVNRIFKINLNSSTVVNTITASVGDGSLVAGFGSLWVIGPGSSGGALARIDPETNRVGDEVQGSFHCCDYRLAAGEGAVWALTPSALYRVNPRTNRADKLSDQGGQVIAVGEGAIWVLNVVHSTVVKVDPETGRDLDTIQLPGSPLALAIGQSAVWVVDGEGAQVIKIPVSGTGGVENIKVGPGPSSITVGEGAVWVVNRDDSSVSRIDPISGAVTTVAVGSDIDEIAVGGGSVWVK